MLENIKLALQGVLGHKLRSLLTMLGIIIGIASIITIVSTIKGTNEQIKQNLIGSGTNAVVVRLYQEDWPYDFSYSPVPDGVAPISENTREELEELDGIEGVSLFNLREYSDNVFYRSTSFSGGVRGVDSHYFDVYNYKLAYGRDFLQLDFDDANRVCLLDSRAVSCLNIEGTPLNQTVEIMNEPFVIIGVVEQHNDFEPSINSINDYYMYADTSSGNIFIPSSTWPMVYRFDEPQCVAVKASTTDEMTSAGQTVADTLNKTQIFTQSGKMSYRSQDLLQQAQSLQNMSNSTNRQLIWIASISLLVGGIGVMNIMLVSVTERTSEIGLKKAIGAKKSRILRQFLTEAAVLTSLGGVIGVIAGVVLAAMISEFMSVPTAISFPAILIAVVFSTVIGVVFGLIPAMKAAKLNPIEALRRD